MFSFPSPFRHHVEPDMRDLGAFVASLPALFADPEAGLTIYRGRNELREFATRRGRVVVKSFGRPSWVNRLVYGFLRASKAERSCLRAAELRALGIGSPEPVGWCEVRRGLFLSESYYACLRSSLSYTFHDLADGLVPEAECEPLLREVGRVAARMHNAGLIHRDFSMGNLMLGFVGGHAACEVIDLNRIRRRHISVEAGIRGFRRLPASEETMQVIVESYLDVRV